MRRKSKRTPRSSHNRLGSQRCVMVLNGVLFLLAAVGGDLLLGGLGAVECPFGAIGEEDPDLFRFDVACLHLPGGGGHHRRRGLD
jgi:hypothetical protein